MKNDVRVIIRMPHELAETLKSFENTSDFIRRAVMEKLMKVRKLDRIKMEVNHGRKKRSGRS